MGPATAWKAGDYGSSTRSREKIEKLLAKDLRPGSKLLLSFGEIDCRIHMAKAVLAGGKIKDVVEKTAAKFVKLPEAIAARGFRPVVWGPPQIIPKDEKSGNASDAGVPEFIDFMMIDQPQRQLLMRGGIKWLDRESRKRFSQPFVKAAPAQQTELCEALAWPDTARPEHSRKRPMLMPGRSTWKRSSPTGSGRVGSVATEPEPDVERFS